MCSYITLWFWLQFLNNLWHKLFFSCSYFLSLYLLQIPFLIFWPKCYDTQVFQSSWLWTSTVPVPAWGLCLSLVTHPSNPFGWSFSWLQVVFSHTMSSDQQSSEYSRSFLQASELSHNGCLLPMLLCLVDSLAVSYSLWNFSAPSAKFRGHSASLHSHSLCHALRKLSNQ